MRNKQNIFIILFILLTIFFANAERGFEFLNISPSPASSSLGDANTSLYLNNASSFFYNPALLTIKFPKFSPITPTVKAIDLYFSYIKYFQEINYFSFFTVMDIKKIKRIGIGFSGFFYGDINSTSYETENSYNTGNKLNFISYFFLIGYGINIADRIGMGINLKLPVEDLGNKKYLGIGADIGVLYKRRDWNVGLVFENIGTDIKKNDVRHNLPMKVKLGGNYSFYLFKKTYPKTHKITTTVDVGKEIEKDFIVGGGLQYGYKEIVFIRNGYFIRKDDVDIRLGCGFQYRNYKIDYAYDGKKLGNIHRIGFGMKFDFKGIEGIEIEELENGELIKISLVNAILFNYNKTELKKESNKVLDKVVEIVKQEKYKEISIIGHTDATGRAMYNLKLSKNRAASVYKYFIKEGIEKKKIMIKGYGEKHPIASNITEKGRARNRRVEIYLKRLNKKDKERFDYHYYSGMDCYYKEGYRKAIKEWEKAIKIDPENEDVKNWIKKARKEVKEKEAKN